TRRVAQLLSAAGPHDAVTNQALAYARMMRTWGIEGDVYASIVVPELKRSVRSVTALTQSLARDDLVVIHYTAHTRGLEDVPNLYLFDRQRLVPTADGDRFRDGKRNVIFVGRLAPNKRQDELVQAFALYQRHREPASRLILGGGAGGVAYRERLEQIAQAMG